MPGGAKNYIFVVNNYESLLDPDLWPHMAFCIYQEEVGESGTPHLQGYVQFTQKRTFATVSQLPGLESAHIEVARGSPADNIAYCTKEEGRLGGPYEYGTRPTKGQGARKDLDVISDQLKAGHSLKRIAEEFPSDFIRYHRGFAALQSHVAPRRSDHMKTQVFVLFGAGGTGKSTFARRLARFLSSDDICSGDIYSVAPPKGSGLYYDGYNQGDVVIFEEFNGARMVPTTFNQLCDAGEYQVPIHGGQCQFNSRYIIITTNVHPSQWWPSLKFVHSLWRRIILFPRFRRLDMPADSQSSDPSIVYEPRLGQFIHRRK